MEIEKVGRTSPVQGQAAAAREAGALSEIGSVWQEAAHLPSLGAHGTDHPKCSTMACAWSAFGTRVTPEERQLSLLTGMMMNCPPAAEAGGIQAEISVPCWTWPPRKQEFLKTFTALFSSARRESEADEQCVIHLTPPFARNTARAARRHCKHCRPCPTIRRKVYCRHEAVVFALSAMPVAPTCEW
jgi:hypothetical protein